MKNVPAGTEVYNERGELIAIAAREVTPNDYCVPSDWLLPDGTHPKFGELTPDGFLPAVRRLMGVEN